MPVEGVIPRFFPSHDKYLYIAIELPEIEEKGELHVTVGLENQKPALHAWFDRNNIPLFRDGKRLHLAPIEVMSLLGPDFTVPAGETSYVDIEVYRNDKELGGFLLAIDGPWPAEDV